MNRRTLLLGSLSASALAALAACSTSATTGGAGGSASAADGDTLTVAGFSGAFADQFTDAVLKPFQDKFNAKVSYVQVTNSAQMLATLRTNAKKPTYDLVIIDSSVAVTANQEGLFSRLDPSIVTALSDLLPTAVIQSGYGPAITIDSLCYVSNPSVVPAAPATWSGMDADAYQGKIALQINDTHGIALIAGLSKEMGLDYKTQGIDKQLAKMKAIGKRASTFQPQPNLYDAIRAGSAGLGLGWNARSQALHDESPDELDVSVPVHGGVAQISTLNLVATSPRAELAQKLIDYAIGVDAQTALAKTAFYGPVNKKVTLDAAVAKRVAVAGDGGLLTDAAPIDWKWIAPKYADWVEQIQREVIGG